MNYDMRECGKRIQSLRIRKGYTQETLAGKLNIDRSLLSHIESGKRGCSVDLLVRLSEVFKVSLDMLILGTERIHPDIVDREQLKETIDTFINQLKLFNERL